MPNSALKDNLHNTGDNGEKEKFSALTQQQHRLRKARESGKETNDYSEFNRLGGSRELNRLETITKTEQDANYNVKKTGMDAGRENQFIDKHEKDRDNANPTAIGGLPQMHKGSLKNKIITNKEVYNEEIMNEISDIRYLIRYMNNNKNKTI
jgi:hypothetical protein